MQIIATREFKFCSSHRIYGHESKCKYIHGHNYRVRVSVQPNVGLDSLGRVLDFSKIKEKIGLWIDENLDHAILISSQDKEIITQAIKEGWRYYTYPGNTTAEIMAQDMMLKFNALIQQYDCKVVKVELWETDNCSVEVTL